MTGSANPTPTTTSDAKVLVCVNHGAADPENVLIAYLVGVEALRAGKDTLMFLTKDGIHIATPGFADTIDIPGAPSVAALHEEFVNKGGRFFACPVCVKTRNMENTDWVPNAEVAGVPSVLEYTTGGALDLQLLRPNGAVVADSVGVLQHIDRGPEMIRLTVSYPSTEGATFDHDYYRNKHVPLAVKTWGLDGAEIDKGIDGPSVAAVHFKFESLDALGAAMGAAGTADVLADVANYTSIAPVLQTSEIVE